MRMMIKVVVPNVGGNDAIKSGALGRVISQFMETHRPEAAYFSEEQGERVAFFVADLKDASDMPVMAEPLFLELNARVSFTPVMTPQDLRAGLERAKH